MLYESNLPTQEIESKEKPYSENGSQSGTVRFKHGVENVKKF